MEKPGSKIVLPAAAIAALHRGEKIEAIKIVRSEQRLDLKDAKDRVDAYLQTQPAIQAGISARQKEAGRRVLPWTAIVAGAAILAWMLFIRK
jgi:ribosomal protein L7/L12